MRPRVCLAAEPAGTVRKGASKFAGLGAAVIRPVGESHGREFSFDRLAVIQSLRGDALAGEKVDVTTPHGGLDVAVGGLDVPVLVPAVAGDQKFAAAMDDHEGLLP
ncbi:hypothetical protein GCM10010869_32210 [Mesorhizobium tianshanense]|nr:hypothetical protein GCM10010869_32210 [Mesorhizobium tianshanense]